MKVLLLVQAQQRNTSNVKYYEAIARHGDVDVVALTADQQANLKKTFEMLNPTQYQRIVLFLRFKKGIKQVRFIRTIPNLVILEWDAFQNYIDDKYHGKFSKHYKAMPWARILSSGHTVSQKLRAEGYDAVFVRKGYDETLLHNQHRPRDIELGFLGSMKSKTYAKRNQFLNQLATREPLVAKRTDSGVDYLNTLNRIKYFIGADIGFGEYMQKNIEAMACGCVLITTNQGDDENAALGFIDMKNVVLYNSMDQLQQKLQLLRGNFALGEAIAQRGQNLVEQQFTFDRVAQEFMAALQEPLRKPLVTKKWGIKKYHYQNG